VSRPFAQGSFLEPSHQECSPGAICATAQAFRVCHTNSAQRGQVKKISPRGLGTGGLVVAFARLGRGRKIHCHLEARPRIQAFLFSYPVQWLECILGKDTFGVAFFTLQFPDAVTI